MDESLTPIFTDLLNRLDADALSALAPGVGAYLESNASLPAKLAEIRRERLRAFRAGDRELYAVLSQMERDLELAIADRNQRRGNGPLVLGGLIVLAFALFVLMLALIPRRAGA